MLYFYRILSEMKLICSVIYKGSLHTVEKVMSQNRVPLTVLMKTWSLKISRDIRHYRFTMIPMHV